MAQYSKNCLWTHCINYETVESFRLKCSAEICGFCFFLLTRHLFLSKLFVQVLHRRVLYAKLSYIKVARLVAL